LSLKGHGVYLVKECIYYYLLLQSRYGYYYGLYCVTSSLPRGTGSNTEHTIHERMKEHEDRYVAAVERHTLDGASTILLWNTSIYI